MQTNQGMQKTQSQPMANPFSQPISMQTAPQMNQ